MVSFFVPAIRIAKAGVFLLVLWVALGVSGARAADTGVVEICVIGTARITGNDLASARNRALERGLNEAVQQAVENLIPRPVLAAGLKRIGELLLAYGQGLVNEYRVLAEDHTQDVYMMLLSVSLVRADLENALAEAGFQVTEQAGRKRVLLLLQGSGADRTVVEKKLAEALSRNGYRVVTGNTYGYDLSQLSVVTLADLGRQKGADAVVQCAWAFDCAPAPEKLETVSCQGQGEFQWIDVGTAALLDRFQVHPSAEDPSAESAREQAIQMLAEVFAEKMVQGIQSRSSAAGLPTFCFPVTIDNVTRYASYRKVEEALRNRIPGMKSVQLQAVQPGRFVLRVCCEGSEGDLIRRLSSLSFKDLQVAARLDSESGIVLTLSGP